MAILVLLPLFDIRTTNCLATDLGSMDPYSWRLLVSVETIACDPSKTAGSIPPSSSSRSSSSSRRTGRWRRAHGTRHLHNRWIDDNAPCRGPWLHGSLGGFEVHGQD
ncbi:hypothetical protein CC80DRAFT_492862 [Byssothecium circinans]|uniref:Secreted protein n=1 Tax=Byssothecium circinans TaxID=147558 RepID=A0A6A5TYZ9_9PLEO|nr:hypothetical protein CC80DRAFT_492862 [Byssothecium circinans]